MIGTHQIIQGDLHNIAHRVKEIDKNYFIALNYKTKKFEVHCLGQRGGSLTLTLPYKKLDERTLNLVSRTKRERAKQLFYEMEIENQKCEKDKMDKILKKAEKDYDDIRSGKAVGV